MDVIELTDIMKQIALTNADCKSVFVGDVYENWNNHPDIKYGSVNISVQNITTDDNGYITYSLILYYGDRLEQDHRNTSSIYADGVNTLQSIINELNTIDSLNIEGDIIYTPFDQVFADHLAGIYCTANVYTDSPIGLCAMDKFIYVDDKDKLIQQLLKEIEKYKEEDAELSVLLTTILRKIKD